MKTTAILFLFVLLLLFQYGCQQDIKDKTIHIVQTTDVHGTIFPYDFIADTPIDHSLASVSTYINTLRQTGDEGIVLIDNGDYFQGQPTVYYYNYEDTTRLNFGVEVYNFLNYDAITVGNHDIECGHAVYDKIHKELKAPWLAANIINTATGAPYFTPYTIIERKGLRIAVLGLITPAILQWLPENIWRGMEFEDMVESARKWEKIIREKEQPDLLIGMFHAGIDFEYNSQTAETFKNENASLLVAKNVPGFDIVLAGHDHKVFNEKIVNIKGDTVVVLDPKSHARAVASIRVDFSYNEKTKGWNKRITPSIVEMNTVEPDAEFLAHFKTEFETIKNYVSTEIGVFKKSLNSADAYFGNSALIDLIQKVQLEYTEADLSFSAPLTFKNKIEAGPITMGDLFKLYKYENLLYTMSMTGTEVDNYLEFSYGLWLNTMHSSTDGLLLMTKDTLTQQYNLVNQYYNFSSAAGIEYVVDVTKPLGKKVRILGFSNGARFYKDSSYTVAINSYRGTGGGGHLTEGSGIDTNELSGRIISSSEHDLRFILMEYIQQNTPINPQPGTNWRIIPEDYYEKAKTGDKRKLFANE